MNEELDVRIGEVITDVTVTEGVGPLSSDDMRVIVAKVLEQVRQALHRDADRDQDTRIHDRVFRPHGG
jgi:hypothetical protein